MALRVIRSPWDRPQVNILTGYIWAHAAYTASGTADQAEGFATGTYSKTLTVWTAAFYLGASAPTSLPAGLTTYNFTATYLPYNSPTGYAGDYSITAATGASFPAPSKFAANNKPITSLAFSGANRLSHIQHATLPTRTHLVQPSGYASSAMHVAYNLAATGSQRHRVHPGAKVADYTYYLVQTDVKLAASGQRMPTSQTTWTATMFLGTHRHHITQVYQPATQWIAVRHYRLRPPLTTDLFRGGYKHAGSPSTQGQSLFGPPAADIFTTIKWTNNTTGVWVPS